MRPDDLPPEVVIFLVQERWGGKAEYRSVDPKQKSPIQGTIIWNRIGPGKPFSVIMVKDTTQGFGPLLYDIAMESAGEHGLMADRLNVSDDALRIWQYYDVKRPDVEKVQMDLNKDKSTYVDQTSAKKDKTVKKWQHSSLSKAYFVNGTPTIDRLKEMGKLV